MRLTGVSCCDYRYNIIYFLPVAFDINFFFKLLSGFSQYFILQISMNFKHKETKTVLPRNACATLYKKKII